MMDKDKALEAAILQIEKDFGKGSIMRMGENKALQVQVIPTGSLALDVALGVGGIPRGRIIEIYGQESSGKSTAALHILAEAQKAGGECAFIDAEHALDPVYAKAIGVDTDRMFISQPNTGEEALAIADHLIRSGAVDLVVVDSVAALVPKVELEGEIGQSHVGLQARLMSQAMRKLTGSLSKSNCAAIFINQLRQKIGITWGNPNVTSGGMALKFYASVRIELAKTEQLKDGADIVGNHIKAKVVKNKLAAPFKIGEFDIIYGKGISREGSLIDYAVTHGFIKKSGSWYTYDGESIGQGKPNATAWLEENPDKTLEIEKKLRDILLPLTLEE